ncbi:hypothetical protein [Clostridium massiliamazoniense]|uniref:hypothetical protein n=1 Tax=Clostridium massiliamazoniense TaxID=1347366 RepID=UPI0006D7A6D1|nr:hypothetical protein [Clostridium massiliamazoniense]
MQQSIIKYLINNNELNDIINVKNNLYPIYALIPDENIGNLTNPVMEYQYIDLKGGLEKQSQLSINIIGTNYNNMVNVQTVLNKILDFNTTSEFIFYDKIKFNSQIKTGTPPTYKEETQLYQINSNYLIKWRYLHE